MGNTTEVRYRPARTVVKVSGTVTVHTRDDGTKVPERVCDVAVATEADPGEKLNIELREDLFHDHEFELTLAADERLAGAGYTTTGVGAQIVEAGLRLGTIAARLAEPAFKLGFAAKVLDNEPKSVDDVFATEKPELSARRKALTEAINQLQTAVAAEAKSAAAGGTPPNLDRLKTLQAALELAHGEAAPLEAQFEAWRARRFPDWTQKLSYTIGVDELPARDGIDEDFKFKQGEYGGNTREMVQKLGTVVVRIEKSPTPKQPSSGADHTGSVFYRYPRRVQLAVYAQEEPLAHGNGAKGPFRLHDLVQAWVVDSLSEWGEVPLKGDLFGKHGATLEFGDAGTLTHLTNKQVGTLGGVATALSGAGAAVEESLEQGAKISAAFKPSDPALTELENEVTWKELQARLAEATRKVARVGSTT